MPKLFTEALSFVKDEKEQIEDATYEIRKALRKARRNYEMKFDNPIDENTGKQKMFIPLTRQEVNVIAPRFELDADAVHIGTNEPGLERKAIIWQEIIRSQLKKMNFQERIRHGFIPWVNEGELTIELFWDFEKEQPDFFIHDVRDIFIFPKEIDLWSASGFGVKKRILFQDFMNSKRYTNKKEVLENTSVDDSKDNQGTMKYEIGKTGYETELGFVELYERNGFFPKNFLTGKKKDADELTDGTITVADIDGRATVVEISEKSNRKNYMEAPFLKRSYLWYGLGIGVGMIDYQWYYNKMFNRRDDNEDVLHRGMFLKTRTTNVDASQRTTGSGLWIEVDRLDGIQQLQTSDITQNSYIGENQLLSNIRLLNGTEDVMRGGGRSRSASEAAIKDRNTGTRLQDPQTNLNLLLKKVVERIMELDSEYLSKNKIIKISGRDDELATFDDFKLSQINRTRTNEGLPPVDKQEFSQAMGQFQGNRFIKIPTMSLLKGDFEVEIDIDTSLIKNRAGQAQTILDSMQIAAQVPGVPQTIDFADLFDQWLRIQGLKPKKVNKPELPMGGGIQSQTEDMGMAPEELSMNKTMV